MKFIARTPRDDVNVSQEHPLVEALTLILGLGALLIALAALLIFFVDFVVLLISPETERELFDDWDFAGSLNADFKGEAITPVDDLVQRLTLHWSDSPYDFRVGLLDRPRANALALPGGTILVTSGLLAQVESENELAFVLAHELGHFRNRDHLRQIGRGAAFGLLLMLLGREDSGLVTNSLVSITARSYGRRQETAADLFALELVYAEYGHVDQAWRFFERAADVSSPLSALGSFWSTHPASPDRIDELKRIADERGWPIVGPTSPLLN